jgi:hypothetical protein
MTAEIELKQEGSPRLSLNNEEAHSHQTDPPLKMEDPEEFLLLEEELENPIPFPQESPSDLLFNLEENSHASNYSKLEKALFGFGMHEEMEEEQPHNESL